MRSAPFLEILNFFDLRKTFRSRLHWILVRLNLTSNFPFVLHNAMKLLFLIKNYLLTGHLILTWVPKKTVAAPPILRVTFRYTFTQSDWFYNFTAVMFLTLFFFGSCWMYVVLLAAMGGLWSSGSHGFALHGFFSWGLMLGQSSGRLSTLCSWAIICLHSTRRSFTPVPQCLKWKDFAQIS